MIEVVLSWGLTSSVEDRYEYNTNTIVKQLHINICMWEVWVLHLRSFCIPAMTGCGWPWPVGVGSGAGDWAALAWQEMAGCWAGSGWRGHRPTAGWLASSARPGLGWLWLPARLNESFHIKFKFSHNVNLALLTIFDNFTN